MDKNIGVFFFKAVHSVTVHKKRVKYNTFLKGYGAHLNIKTSFKENLKNLSLKGVCVSKFGSPVVQSSEFVRTSPETFLLLGPSREILNQ